MFTLKKIPFSNIITVLFFLTFFSAIASSFYLYYFAKDYNYLVETACDPLIENCFVRDCEESPDDCPPNMLSSYRVYYIKAYDFKNCSADLCKVACESGSISCEPVACGESEEDVCSLSLIEETQE